LLILKFTASMKISYFSVYLWALVLTPCYFDVTNHIRLYLLIGKKVFNMLIVVSEDLYLCSTGRCCCFRECTHIH
jgi:hypothetical protein